MMRNSEGTLIPVDFGNIYDQIPRLAAYDIEIETSAFENPIDSSDMNPSDWKRIAEEIYQQFDAYDGFVVLHGTDTMAYTASALSFMFENLSKPIILTGSQLPLDVPRTDGRRNIINSVEIAAACNSEGLPMIPEVAICFESKLYRGNRSYKNNAEGFNAFSSPNYPLLAQVGVNIKYNKEFIYKSNKEKTKLSTQMDPNIAVLKLHPGINPRVVESVLGIEGLKGVVLETYGAGNSCKSEWFLHLLSNAVRQGVHVLNVTQCKEGGSVSEGKYESSRLLGKIGVISGYDINTESAVAKMMYLLGTVRQHEKIKSLLSTPLRGEMTVD